MDNDDEEPPTFDVGVAIAKKKKAQQHAKEEEEVTTPKNQATATNASLRDFLYGASLYIACLALPTLLGLTGVFDTGEKQSPVMSYPEEQSYYHQASEYLCETGWTYWCFSETDESLAAVHAPDTEWTTDVGIVAVLSLTMAMIRLLLVHLLVPRYLAPKRLEALVRCKSVHLLSSAYPKSLTPQSSKRTLSVDTDNMPPPPPLLAQEEEEEEKGDDLSSSLHGVKQSLERYFTKCRIMFIDLSHSCSLTHYLSIYLSHSVLSSGQRSARRVLGVEPKSPYDGDELQDTDRLFSAPRYATAVFRLVYCIWSCTCAVIWLLPERFWPLAVGGTGATKNCWDLRGGVALETTADFDNANAVLRKYFLVQASYHLHSWATHWMSLIALWWYGTSFVSIRKSMISYWRALLQHLMALTLIGGCYFFSSLRRLGVIGIFALDVSSLFVHLLQLCINAPPDSLWHQPLLIAWIHRGLVIPIFLYVPACRVNDM